MNNFSSMEPQSSKPWDSQNGDQPNNAAVDASTGEQVPVGKKKPKRTKVSLIFLVLGLFVLAGFATAFTFYTQLQDFKRNPQALAQRDAEQLIAQVGRHIVLPQDESPTIATVTDPEKLRDQQFFAKAKVGDKVLIYTKALKAILYDPTADKILEVAPVNIGQTQGISPPAAAPSGVPQNSNVR